MTERSGSAAQSRSATESHGAGDLAHQIDLVPGVLLLIGVGNVARRSGGVVQIFREQAVLELLPFLGRPAAAGYVPLSPSPCVRLKLAFSGISNDDKPALAVYAARWRGKEVRLAAIFQGRIDNRYNARFVELDDLFLAVATEIHCTVGAMNEPRQMIIIERHPMRAIEPPKAALREHDWTIEFFKPFDNALR